MQACFPALKLSASFEEMFVATMSRGGVLGQQKRTSVDLDCGPPHQLSQLCCFISTDVPSTFHGDPVNDAATQILFSYRCCQTKCSQKPAGSDGCKFSLR